MSEKATMPNQAPAPENEPVYVPRVDVRETAEGFAVVADLPGVDEKSVEATVQNRVLTIEGWTNTEKPQGYEELGREFGAGRFRRDFTRADRVDSQEGRSEGPEDPGHGLGGPPAGNRGSSVLRTVENFFHST